MGALEEKVIVVTGASRGLGEAMAVGFAKEGAKLVLAARTMGDLERVAKECESVGSASAQVIPTDVTEEAQVTRLIDDTVKEQGRIDVFVANAGTSYANLTDKRYREIITYDLEIVEQLLRVNTIGTWLCLRAALGAMGPGGNVITIGSEAGRIRYPGAGFYAVTKSAVDALTEISAKEVATKGLRINCLSPGGMVDTHLFGPNKMPDSLKQHGFLEPDVIVPAAVWLASDESAPITGAFVSAKDFNERGAGAIRASIEAAQTEKPGAGRH